MRRNLAGFRFGNYSLEEKIGSGGMGTVYLGEDNATSRKVAVKIIDLEDRDPSQFTRFTREVKSLSMLRHPNIITIYDVGFEGAIHYYAMELLEGDALDQVIDERAPLVDRTVLPLPRALEIATDVAEALAHCHENGIIHRDIKPSNIHIDEETGKAILLDFGLARLDEETSAVTKEGCFLGTMLYMAPEQIAGKATDERTDVYQYGLLLYVLETGHVPFASSNIHSILARRIAKAAPSPCKDVPELPAWLEGLTLHCLAMEPDDRPPSMSEVARCLREKVDSRSVFAVAGAAEAAQADTFSETDDDGSDGGDATDEPPTETATEAEPIADDPSEKAPKKRKKKRKKKKKRNEDGSDDEGHITIVSSSSKDDQLGSTSPRLPIRRPRRGDESAPITIGFDDEDDSTEAAEGPTLMIDHTGHAVVKKDDRNTQPIRPPRSAIEAAGQTLPYTERHYMWAGLAIASVLLIALGLAHLFMP